MKYVDDKISTKVRILSLWATMAVVIIHSNSLEGIKENAFAWWVGNVVAVLQYWAVPWFFVVSGFFFDRGYVACDVSTSVFMRKKVASLLVPYVLWGAVWGGAILTPVLMYVNLKNGRLISENTFLDAPSFLGVIDKLFGGLRGAPPNGALWYVRMLLITFLFAPLLKWFRTRFAKARWGILCMATLIIAFSSEIYSGNEAELFTICGIQIGLKLSGVGYFLMGMVASTFSLETFKPSKMFACVFAVLCCAGLGMLLGFRYVGTQLPFAMGILLKFLPLFAIAFLWSLTWRQTSFVNCMMPMRFWIYCMHHPITAYVAAGLHAVLGYSIYAEFLRMVLGAPICFTIVAVSGLIIKKKYHKAFAVLNGGR